MKVSEFRRQLLSWYEGQRRDLPWRRTVDPYAIWVSEIMLQQTRVATVVPYYERFLARFPNIEALANAPADDLLRAWSGLGYYSRAHNMQKAAKATGGRFPTTLTEIQALPGIGEYTAAAVASIAFGLPYAAVDGNCSACREADQRCGEISERPVRRRLTEVARSSWIRTPGRFQSGDDGVGATVCLPREPQCLICPVRHGCEARQTGLRRAAGESGSRRMVRLRRTLVIAEHGPSCFMAASARFRENSLDFGSCPSRSTSTGRVTEAADLGQFRHFITNHAYTVRSGYVVKVLRMANLRHAKII